MNGELLREELQGEGDSRGRDGRARRMGRGKLKTVLVLPVRSYGKVREGEGMKMKVGSRGRNVRGKGR